MFPPAIICCLLFFVFGTSTTSTGTKISRKSYEAQLYEDLLFEYNKIARPVKNSSDVLHVDVGASLIRIIDVDEKNQVLTTNLWLEMQWNDFRLQWDPDKYGGIRQLHIPSTDIWIPDFVLYDNAAGDPDITIFTDALVSYTSRVYWQPPAIYKSYCQITVKWFPYDKQNCRMKFGIWSYTGNYVDLHLIQHDEPTGGMLMPRGGGGGGRATSRRATRRAKRQQQQQNDSIVGTEAAAQEEYMEMGMDLSFFYRSAEWDLMNLTSERHAMLYTSCCGPETYVDITYYLELRRKTLFFTTNLIIPCFLISFLTTFVFYLSDHKITFSISILVTLTVFYLVLIDLMPPTSLEVPMFGQYLITTMVLVALSTMVSVITVNIRFRNGATHQMSPWIRIVFLNLLPKLLFMKRPEQPAKPELPAQLPAGTSLASPIFSAATSNNNNALSAICPTLVRSQPLIQQTGDGSVREEEEEEAERRKRPSRLLFNLNNISHGSPATVQLPSSSSLTLPKNTLLVNKVRPPPYSAAINETAVNSFKWQSCSNSLDKRQLSQSGMELPVTKLIGNGKRHTRTLELPGGGGRGGPTQLWAGTSGQHRGERFVGVGSLDAKMRANEIIFGNLVKQVRFIAEYFRRSEEEAEISDDWTFVAMVLDRLFLVIFSVLNMATFSIIISAPTLFDFREPLNVTVPTRPLGQANLFSIHNDYF